MYDWNPWPALIALGVLVLIVGIGLGIVASALLGW